VQFIIWTIGLSTLFHKVEKRKRMSPM